MHMCVELGVVRRQVKDNKGKEKLVTEYLDAQLSDRALEALLCLGYEQFKVSGIRQKKKKSITLSTLSF